MFQFPTTFPILTSSRLCLRKIVDSDAAALLALRSNKEVMQYIPRPIMQTEEEAVAFVQLLNNVEAKEDGINWAITLMNDEILIGNVCHFNFEKEFLRSEIGYMLSPAHQNKGIMTEAVKMILQYGFEQMGLHSCLAIINESNIASQKVAEKVGMILEGHFKENQIVHGKFTNTNWYSILKRNFQPIIT
jgi:[ribosomal protein S5]-alanine N-acetyltransferase